MAITLDTGDSQANAAVAAAPLHLDADAFKLLKDDPGECQLANVAGTLDQPNTIRYSVQPIADIFNAAPIDPDADQRRDGHSYLIQVNETWKKYDAADTSVTPVYFPASAHMVLKLPVDALVTADVAKLLVRRLLGALTMSATDSIEDGLGPLLVGVTHVDPPVT